jgi:DNA-binding MarR family transcriptional regulator
MFRLRPENRLYTIEAVFQFPESGKNETMLSQPALRPVDVVVALRLSLRPEEKYESLAAILGIGLSAAHRSVKRLESAGLVLPHRRDTSRRALIEFLVHGVKYAFFPVTGPEAPGVPTAYSGPPLAAEIVSDRPLVWASARGTIRGDTLVPLYEGAPELADRAPELYEAVTLVDAIRAGRARERKLAAEMLEHRLHRPDEE